MKMHHTKSQTGFTLLELIISAFIGLTLMAAATSMFRQANYVLFVVTQRAETQQNMRAGIELMTKDLSMAGAGLPSGGLQLPTSGGSSKIACSTQSGTCYITGDVYPTGNFMYGIIPGYNNGVQNGPITAAPSAVNDSVTSIYCDYNFPLNNFTFTFPSSTQATVAVVNAAATPNNILAPGGLNVGDLLLFIVSSPGNGTGNQGTSSVQTGVAVADITGIPNNTTIDFASGDILNLNQSGASSLASLIAGLGGGATMTVCRLYAVTYFIQVPPAGGTIQTPRLMRQVNALNAVPVADNIINLQLSYDVINSITGTVNANESNPVAAGLSPALIRKVNLWVMGQGLISGNNRSQSMYLASSVSARNMSFCNSLSDSTTQCQ